MNSIFMKPLYRCRQLSYCCFSLGYFACCRREGVGLLQKSSLQPLAGEACPRLALKEFAPLLRAASDLISTSPCTRPSQSCPLQESYSETVTRTSSGQHLVNIR